MGKKEDPLLIARDETFRKANHQRPFASNANSWGVVGTRRLASAVWKVLVLIFPDRLPGSSAKLRTVRSYSRMIAP